MDQSRPGMSFAGPGMMLISAALFGFFGFFMVNWNTPGVNGQAVLFRVLCGWTLKVSAIVFIISAVLTMVNRTAGNLLYSAAGLIGAVLFVIVAILDVLDPQHSTVAYGPAILLLFAAWNGYGSWASLREMMAARRPSGELTPS